MFSCGTPGRRYLSRNERICFGNAKVYHGEIPLTWFTLGGYDTISETMRLVQIVGILRDLASLNQSPFEIWVICHGLEPSYTMRSWLAPCSNRCGHFGTAALQCVNEICHSNCEEIGCIPTPVRGRLSG